MRRVKAVTAPRPRRSATTPGHARRVTVAALLLTLASLTPSRGQAQQATFEVDAVVGASNAARDVATYEGRLLVATQSGLLVREASGESRLLGPRDGMPGARLNSVSITPEGVWIGGVEAAVLLDSQLRPVRDLALPRVSRVRSFAGHTYAATFGRGLFRLGDADEEPEHIHLGRSHARERQTDAKIVGDELWVSTAGAGILRVSSDGTLRARITHVAGLVDDLVWGMSSAGDHILVATASGVSVIRGRRVRPSAALTRAAQTLPIRDVRAVLATDDGAWVATYGGGVYKLRGASAVAHPSTHGLAGQRGRALAMLGEQVFLATDAGLGRVTARSVAFGDTRSLESADITSLERAFGKVWVGTFDRGLARLVGARLVPVSVATGRWHMDGRVNDLAVVGRGSAQRLYIATDRGLYRHDGRSFVPVLEPGAPPQSHVTSLFVEPHSGVLWVTGSDYLGRLEGDTWRAWTGDELPNAHLHAVARDSAGRIWVGGLRGLYRMEDAGFTRHDVSTGDLPVNWVTALVPWGRGVVAGTYHGGLSWGGAERFHIERESPEGLPAGWVNPHAMAKVAGQLWVGTQSRGLVIGSRGQWLHLGRSDGLPSDDVTDILADGSGAAWVATRGGLAHVTSTPTAERP